MTIDSDLINVCPKFVNNRPSHCPKCGSTHGFSKEYYLSSQTGDYICDNCKVCVENYIDEVMNLRLDGTPKKP